MKSTLLALAALLSIRSFASIVQFAEPSTITQSGVTVTVYAKANVSVPNAKVAAKLTGAGVRKFGGFIPVYHISSLVDEAVTLSSEESAVSDLNKSKARVLQLTMIKKMTPAEIRKGFGDALGLNGIDVEKHEVIKKLLADFNKDIPKGKTVTIVGFPLDNGNEKVVIELPDQEEPLQGEYKDLATDFWKIWFGEVADDMVELREQLVGKAN